METLKSIAIVSLLGAVLYGVYVVASKPEKPLPPEIAAHESSLATLPVVDRGTSTASGASARNELLAPPKLTAPNPLASEMNSVPAIPSPPPRLAVESTRTASDSQVQPASNWEEESVKSRTAPAANEYAEAPNKPKNVANSLRTSIYEAAPLDPIPAITETKPPVPASPKTDARVSGVSYTRNAPAATEEASASQTRVRVYAFHQAWKGAQEQVRESRYREALLTLSAFYDDTAIPPAERQALLEWLDALAARVVYSTEHFLEHEYVVRRNESLYAIAEQYHVPYLLLKNINGVRDPELLLPGTKLKVVPGPFRAEVSMKRKEITLFVGGLYAGRFPCEFGNIPVRAGDYAVKDKSNRKAFYTNTGTLAPNDPRNPFGGIWLDLGNDVSIHGTSADAYQAQNPGCISLAPRDADDIFGILNIGSQVAVKE